MPTSKAPARKPDAKKVSDTWFVIIEQMNNSRSYFEVASSEANALEKAKNILEDEELLESLGMDPEDTADYEVRIVKVAAQAVYSAKRSGVVLEKIR